MEFDTVSVSHNFMLWVEGKTEELSTMSFLSCQVAGL